MESPIRILVVDDDAGVQTSLSAFLEDEGFDVQSTGDAAKALAILQTKPFDVAIVDIRLGGIGGEELILRGTELSPATRFLIFTGSLDYVLPESLRRLGLDSTQIFYKPVRSLQVVADKVRHILTQKEQQDVQHS